MKFSDSWTIMMIPRQAIKICFSDVHDFTSFFLNPMLQ
jgi:hypothetical protein